MSRDPSTEQAAPESAPAPPLSGPGGDARESLVAEHADLVYSLARRMTGDEEEARDLFQESFVKIFQGLPAFEGRSSLRTWICQIVINSGRNRRRWWSRLRRNLPAASPPETDLEAVGGFPASVPDPAPGPERQAMSAETRGRIESALRRIPEEQRLAVLLRDVEGLAYEEIADALGIAIGTVKSKIARGRAALREQLADLAGRTDGRVTT